MISAHHSEFKETSQQKAMRKNCLTLAKKETYNTADVLSCVSLPLDQEYTVMKKDASYSSKHSLQLYHGPTTFHV